MCFYIHCSMFLLPCYLFVHHFNGNYMIQQYFLPIDFSLDYQTISGIAKHIS